MSQVQSLNPKNMQSWKSPFYKDVRYFIQIDRGQKDEEFLEAVSQKIDNGEELTLQEKRRLQLGLNSLKIHPDFYELKRACKGNILKLGFDSEL